ncbi:50S ribosomal protein L35 [Actinopolymorpha sp. B11F2]|uniref:50S ribosomal protein L35 n=1 Tax=Actinopolymorpha sp. B11F2 TaxID=3160862 RepID=UPI0032E3D62A
MPKMKTHSGAKKRFRVTASGKLMHNRASRSAKMEKKAAKVSRRLAPAVEAASSDKKKIKRLLAR